MRWQTTITAVSIECNKLRHWAARCWQWCCQCRLQSCKCLCWCRMGGRRRFCYRCRTWCRGDSIRHVFLHPMPCHTIRDVVCPRPKLFGNSTGTQNNCLFAASKWNFSKIDVRFQHAPTNPTNLLYLIHFDHGSPVVACVHAKILV